MFLWFQMESTTMVYKLLRKQLDAGTTDDSYVMLVGDKGKTEKQSLRRWFDFQVGENSFNNLACNCNWWWLGQSAGSGGRLWLRLVWRSLVCELCHCSRLTAAGSRPISLHATIGLMETATSPLLRLPVSLLFVITTNMYNTYLRISSLCLLTAKPLLTQSAPPPEVGWLIRITTRIRPFTRTRLGLIRIPTRIKGLV